MISRKTLKWIVVALTIVALTLTSAAIVLAYADFAVTVDPTARVSTTGVAVLTGMVTCDTPVNSLTINGTVRQSAGRKNVVKANFIFRLPYGQTCSGEMPWEAVAAPSTEGFKKGAADVILTIYGCGQNYGCQEPQTLKTITLIPDK